MDEVIGLLYEIAKNAPALMFLVVFVILVGSAVVFGSKSRRFDEIRASLNRLTESLSREQRILGELRESTNRLESGVDDIETTANRIRSGIDKAEKANADALDLLGRIQSGDDNQNSSSNSD